MPTAGPVLLSPTNIAEDPRFLEEQLITYIGNKRALLPFLGEAITLVRKRLGERKLATLDLFSGSGVVARYLKQDSHTLIANDLESYSRVVNECHLANSTEYDLAELARTLAALEKEIAKDSARGFITELYAPKNERRITKRDRVFYTRRNALYLDAARRAIGRLPAELQKFFLGPLLSEASVHANTSGVFKGFYKNAAGVGQFGGDGKDALIRILGGIRLELPVFSRFDCEVRVHQRDANALLDELPEVDLAYIDPPYNQHPYGSNYFMLNLLVDYREPREVSRVSGIPVDWNRSRYNKRPEAEAALFDTIGRCRAKYILLSYNSEGFVPHGDLLAFLAKCGRHRVMSTPYNTFRGSRNLGGRARHVTEYLYLLEK